MGDILCLVVLVLVQTSFGLEVLLSKAKVPGVFGHLLHVTNL